MSDNDRWEIIHPSELDRDYAESLSNNPPSSRHSMSNCLPPWWQNLLGYPHSSPLPSIAATEQFALSQTGLWSYGGLHPPTPTAIGPVDFGLAPDLMTSQSWGSARHDHLPVPNQCQNQIAQGFPCGWSRDLDACPVPPTAPMQAPLMLPVTDSYQNTEQYDAWMWHVLGGDADQCASSDGDSNPLALGFLRASNDYDFSPDVRPGPLPPVAQDSNAAPLVQPQSSFAVIAGSDPTHGPDHSTRTLECRWLTANGTPCGFLVVAERRSVVEHQHRAHGFRPGDEKARESCHWEQCKTILNRESLARHILTIHFKEGARCDDCGASFAREDSLKRHLKGGLHNGPHEKRVAKRPPP